MRFPRVIGAIGAAAALAALVPPPAAQVAQSPSARYAAMALRPVIGEAPLVGGSPALNERQRLPGFASPAAMPQMTELPLPTPLWYDQNPRLIRADHTGGLSLDNFLVAGDVATLAFERPALSAADDDYLVRESWPRTSTTDIEGHLVSVFNPSWDSAALWDSIGWQRRGFDHPYARFGELLISRTSDTTSDSETVERFAIWVRVAPLNLPTAQVAQIDANTQYASHVVNLVMPGFGEGRLSAGDYGHQLDEAAKRFYAHFRDEYASIAFVPRQQHVVPYDAFHHNVRNPITGLGTLPVFDDTEAYGSAGVLRSVELYPNVSFTSNGSSTHAISHQWVDYWDWSGLAGGIERGVHLPGIAVGVAGDCGDDDLAGRQPQRQVAGVVLDQDADEALEGTQDGSVQHHRPPALSVGGGVSRVEAFGQHEIHLQGAALPAPPDGVGQHELELRAVEGTLARIVLDREPGLLDGAQERRLGPVPDRVVTGAHLGAVGELHQHVLEAEVAVDRPEEADEAAGLGGDLVLRTEDVRVVLDEGAQAHEAVQGARGFVAVAAAELRHPEREVAVALEPLLVDLHVPRAVHGLEGEHAAARVLGLRDEHVFAELLPVPGTFPELAVDELGGLDLLVALCLQAAAHVGADGAVERGAAGVPEDRACRFLLEMEERHLAAEAPVVAPGRFLEAVEMGVEFLPVAPGGAVDALEHRVA